ncbi:MAG: PadR family transcriptional regulator [Pseudomonadota bacterium]
MSLRYAILASLDSQPQTGYAIAREFDSGVGYFWHATHQQIYRELRKLTDEALVEFEQIQQDSKPSKKQYLITASGRGALSEWLTTPTEIQPIRDPLLVKISAGHLTEPDVLAREILAHRARFDERLKVFQRYEQTYRECGNSVPVKQQYLYLTLRRGIIVCEAWIAWADEALAFLSAETSAQNSISAG